MTISGTRVISTSSEMTLDLLLTGDFGNLPGGAIGAAFGMQGRAQELDQVADEAELSGNFLGGGGILPLNEDREIYSVFTEFALPLHETLEAQLALRYDHYSDFGSTTNPKIGLGWRPVDEFLLRATWGTSFRPPTFRELYSPRETYLALVEEDPHRCPATGDVFDCFGNVVEAEFQGNADLQPDEGETLLLGFAWEPQFAPGLELAVDLWQIEHKDRILDSGSFILQELLLEELDPFTNPFTIRAPQTPEDAALGIPGVIVGLSDTYVNGDTLDTNGVDFALMYDWSTSRSGDFNASVNYTYLNEYFVGTDFRELKLREDWAGQYGFIGGLPKHRANFRFNWMREAHGVSALIAYAGDYESWLNLHVDGIETDQPFVIDDYAQLDLQYSYVFERLRGGMIRVGCRNCTDEDPPVYNQTVDSEAFHEGRGAMVYIRWSQPF
jgi:outer membrane receptor protein involved in Fe transport